MICYSLSLAVWAGHWDRPLCSDVTEETCARKRIWSSGMRSRSFIFFRSSARLCPVSAYSSQSSFTIPSVCFIFKIPVVSVRLSVCLYPLPPRLPLFLSLSFFCKKFPQNEQCVAQGCLGNLTTLMYSGFLPPLPGRCTFFFSGLGWCDGQRQLGCIQAQIWATAAERDPTMPWEAKWSSRKKKKNEQCLSSLTGEARPLNHTLMRNLIGIWWIWCQSSCVF